VILLFLSLMMTDWQWPVDTSHGLTSSFGEYRGERFHMGLDFSTDNREGEPVKPARAGRIFRIRASENGYGRVIYMAHGGGYTTVYAHLAAFGETVNGALAEKGITDPTDFFGELEMDLQVGRDEVIAYSGESGAGPPHVHFEVRHEQKPVDPLSLSFPELPESTLGPRIEGVLLIPLAEDSRVNGRDDPFFAGKGVDQVRAEGRIGLQVVAHIAGKRGSRLGCRGIRVSRDGNLIGEWLPQTISFDDYRRAGLVLDQAYSGFGPTRFSYCFDGRVDHLGALPGFRQEAVLEVAEPTRVAIEILDYKGSWQTFSLSLDPGALVRLGGDLPDMPTQPTSLRADFRQHRLMLETTLPGTLQLADALEGLAAKTRKTLFPKAGVSETLIWRTDAGNLRRAFGGLGPGRSLEIGSWRFEGGKGLPDGVTGVLLEPADPSIMATVLSFESAVAHFSRRGLPTSGTRVRFSSEGLTQPEQFGLYTWSFNKQSWRWLGPLDEAHSLSGFVPIVAARDLVPPTIGKPRVHPYFNGERVVIPVRDRGSGIDREQISVSGRDGEVAVRYDGDRRWLILPKGSGNGPWRVTIRDRAGRHTSVSDLRR